MVLNSPATAAISSRPSTCARAAESPSPSRRAAWLNTPSGRSSRAVSQPDDSTPTTQPSAATPTSTAFKRTAARSAASLLRTIASWLSARICSAAPRTATTAGCTSEK